MRRQISEYAAVMILFIERTTDFLAASITLDMSPRIES
jgi:hypothetical protein